MRPILIPAALAGTLALALTACGYDPPDDQYYAAAVCVDQDGTIRKT